MSRASNNQNEQRQTRTEIVWSGVAMMVFVRMHISKMRWEFNAVRRGAEVK